MIEIVYVYNQNWAVKNFHQNWTCAIGRDFWWKTSWHFDQAFNFMMFTASWVLHTHVLKPLVSLMSIVDLNDMVYWRHLFYLLSSFEFLALSSVVSCLINESETLLIVHQLRCNNDSIASTLGTVVLFFYYIQFMTVYDGYDNLQNDLTLHILFFYLEI